MSIKVRVGILVAALVGALIGSVTTALLYPRPDTSPIDNATKVLLVTAAVESKPVHQVYSLGAAVISETLSDIMPTAGGAGWRLVVSGRVHAVGDIVHYGDVVVEVSGRPVFAVPSSLPLYRDIVEGTQGSDVTVLQQMLKGLGLYEGTVDGKATKATTVAAAKLYTRAGYAAPSPPGLLMGDTAPIPADALPVAAAARMGEEISGDHPLMSLVMSPAVITARVDMLQAQVFTVQTTVNVQVGATAAAPSVVIAVGPFQEGTNGQSPGYDITVALPEGVDATIAAQGPVIVSEAGDVPTGPAVPLSAIRTDANGGNYVNVATDDGSASAAPSRQVSVSVVGQTVGYAIIEENPNLPIGTKVVVAGG